MGIRKKNTTKAKQTDWNVLSTAQQAMITSIHPTLDSSPGAVVFSRDMFLNVSLLADWHASAQNENTLLITNSCSRTPLIEDMTAL